MRTANHRRRGGGLPGAPRARNCHYLLVPTIPVLVMALAAAACSDSGSSSSKKGKGEGSTVGIDPLIYECKHLVTEDQVAEALGGKVELMQVAFEPPPGVPEPCNYLLTLDDGTQEPWTFDMDCRSDALASADKLFAQYEKTRMNDAGALTNETGMVPLGRKAMDHHGQALIAVDDDTDCYVRIMGPTSEGRAAFGKLVLDNLEWKNAPMRPRAL